MNIKKELSTTRNTAVNGMVIYGLLVYFHLQGKIRHENMRITFAALALWFTIVTVRYFTLRREQKDEVTGGEKIVLLLSVLNIAVYIAGAMGFYYGYMTKIV